MSQPNFMKLVNPEVRFLPMNIEYAASLGLPFVQKGALAEAKGAVVCGTAPSFPQQSLFAPSAVDLISDSPQQGDRDQDQGQCVDRGRDAAAHL